jgi:hypothetical protein
MRCRNRERAFATRCETGRPLGEESHEHLGEELVYVVNLFHLDGIPTVLIDVSMSTYCVSIRVTMIGLAMTSADVPVSISGLL